MPSFIILPLIPLWKGFCFFFSFVFEVLAKNVRGRFFSLKTAASASPLAPSTFLKKFFLGVGYR